MSDAPVDPRWPEDPIPVGPRVPHADDGRRRLHPDAPEGPRRPAQRPAAETARRGREILRAADGPADRGQRPVQPRGGHGAVQQARGRSADGAARRRRRSCRPCPIARSRSTSSSTATAPPIDGGSGAPDAGASRRSSSRLRRELIGDDPLIVRRTADRRRLRDPDRRRRHDRRARRAKRRRDRELFDEWRGGVRPHPPRRPAHHRSARRAASRGAPDGRKAGARISAAGRPAFLVIATRRVSVTRPSDLMRLITTTVTSTPVSVENPRTHVCGTRLALRA